MKNRQLFFSPNQTSISWKNSKEVSQYPQTFFFLLLIISASQNYKRNRYLRSCSRVKQKQKVMQCPRNSSGTSTSSRRTDVSRRTNESSKIARQLYVYQAQSKSATHSKIYKVKASELRRIHRERVSLELLNIQPLNPFEDCPIDSDFHTH